MRLTNAEFRRSNPALVFDIGVILVDIPDDQPPWLGVRTRCAGADPREHVDYTLKLPRELAEELYVKLGAVLALVPPG